MNGYQRTSIAALKNRTSRIARTRNRFRFGWDSATGKSHERRPPYAPFGQPTIISSRPSISHQHATRTVDAIGTPNRIQRRVAESDQRDVTIVAFDSWISEPIDMGDRILPIRASGIRPYGKAPTRTLLAGRFKTMGRGQHLIRADGSAGAHRITVEQQRAHA